MNKSYLVYSSIKIGATLILPLFGVYGGLALCLLLCYWTLKGPRQAIEALLLVWLLVSLNPGLYPVASEFSLFRWLIIILALVVGLLRAVDPKQEPLPAERLWVVLFLFGSLIASVTLLASYNVGVSLFKLIAFHITSATILLCVRDPNDARILKTIFLPFLLSVVVIAGSPLLVFQVGYHLNETGFQGLLKHPQTYGMFVAVYLVWLFALLIDHHRYFNVYSLSAVLVAMTTLIMSQARTAAVAVLIGTIYLVAIKMIQYRAARQRIALIAPVAIVVLIAISGTLLLLFDWSAADTLHDFIIKQGRDGAFTFSDTVQGRSLILRRSLANFYEHPMLGIGFGLASDPGSLVVVYENLFGLPVSAPVEKSNLYIAILEEAGVIGMCVVLFLLAALLKVSLASQSAINGAVLVTVMVLSMGEAFLFAMGGFALPVWVIVLVLHRVDASVQ